MAAKLSVQFRLPSGEVRYVRGQEANTLLLLHERGPAGVLAYDFRGGPPFRLPAYTWASMRRHGLIIETIREKHDGGWHGRFVLHTPIEVVAVHDPASRMREAA